MLYRKIVIILPNDWIIYFIDGGFTVISDTMFEEYILKHKDNIKEIKRSK